MLSSLKEMGEERGGQGKAERGNTTAGEDLEVSESSEAFKNLPLLELHHPGSKQKGQGDGSEGLKLRVFVWN